MNDFCKLADERGYDWVWINTCCINKSSSAELSEAINSMYRWYKESHVCFVYLSDLGSTGTFEQSRWFTRGWTLQELLAPAMVEFYDKNWMELGNKTDLSDFLSDVSGIDKDALLGTFQPDRYTAGVKMSWASMRTTTREEDEAYSLLGIFGVNMPLLYGEGFRAFQRLQEEILKVTEDYTLLVWDHTNAQFQTSAPVLASSPTAFRNLHNQEQSRWGPRDLVHIDNYDFASAKAEIGWKGGPRIEYLDPNSVRTEPEPPRVTARGLLVTLPFIEDFSPGMGELKAHLSQLGFKDCHLVFIYSCSGDYMVCLILKEAKRVGDERGQGNYHRFRHAIQLIKPEAISVRLRTIYLRVSRDPTRNPLASVLARGESRRNYSATCILSGSSAGIQTQSLRPLILTKNMAAYFLIKYGDSHIHTVASLRGVKMPACYLFESTKDPSDEAEAGAVIQVATEIDPQTMAEVRLQGGEEIRAIIRLRPTSWEQRQGRLGLLTSTQLEDLWKQKGEGAQHVYSLEISIPTNPSAKLDVVKYSN